MNIKNTTFWIVSILFAFSVGYFFNNKPQEKLTDTHEINHAPVTKIERSELTKVKNVIIEPASESKEKNITALDNQSIIREVNSLLGNSRYMIDFASIAKSYSLIQNFSEQDVSEALSEFEGTLNNTKNAMVVSLLVGRYAAINPYGAVDFIENNIKSSNIKNTYLSSVITSWAKKDPSSAYDWVKENEREKQDTGFMSSYKYVSIFNGLAKQDINDAFLKLNEMADNGDSANMAAMGIADSLTGGEEFTAFYENTKNLNSERMMVTAVTSWVNKDPEVVTEWLTSVEAGENKSEMEEAVLNNWINSEPSKAAEWYMNESSETERQVAAENVVRSWARTEPKKALEWISQQSDIDTGLTTKSLLESSLYKNTQFAIDNLDLLNNDKDQQKISRQIYYTLKRKNKKKAESFLNDSAYKEYILKKRQRRTRK